MTDSRIRPIRMTIPHQLAPISPCSLPLVHLAVTYQLYVQMHPRTSRRVMLRRAPQSAVRDSTTWSSDPGRFDLSLIQDCPKHWRAKAIRFSNARPSNQSPCTTLDKCCCKLAAGIRYSSVLENEIRHRCCHSRGQAHSLRGCYARFPGISNSSTRSATSSPASPCLRQLSSLDHFTT